MDTPGTRPSRAHNPQELYVHPMGARSHPSTPCSRSGHMRIQGGEIPARGGVAERLVWSDGIVVLLPGVQRLLQRWQVEVLRITLPELPPRGAVEALDPAVELGRAGRQHIEGDPSVLAGLLELGHELRSAIDLERLHRERHPGYEFVEKGQRRARRRAGAHAEHGTTGDDIDRGEL